MSFRKVIPTTDPEYNYIVEISSDLNLPVVDTHLSLSLFEAVEGYLELTVVDQNGVRVETELEESISVEADTILANNAVEHNGRYYTTGTQITNFKAGATDTQNEGIGFFDIQPLSSYDNIAFKLFRQDTYIDPNTNEYGFTEITPDLKNKTESFYLNTAPAASGVVDIQLLESPATTVDELSALTSFENNTTYKLQVYIGKLVQGEMSTGVCEISFISGDVRPVETVYYNSVATNPIFKLNNLDVAKDIDNLDSFPQVFNYMFSPTSNINGKDSLEVDASGTPINLQFDISDFLEKQFINQYLIEYNPYFSSISDDTQRLHPTTDIIKKQITDLKKILIKNSNLINASFKGSEKGMNIIFGIFCQALGYHLLKLEPSATLKNFVYRITTSLPKEYWISDIKDIIHPLSWQDEYIEVQIDSKANILFYDFSTKFNVLEKINPVSYLDINNIEKYHLYPDVFDLSILKNFHSEDKFNFHANEYSVNQLGMGTDAAFLADLHDGKISISNTGRVSFEYNYFLNYKWQTSIDGFATFETFNTYTNYITIAPDTSPDIRLMVSTGDWSSDYIYLLNAAEGFVTEAGANIYTESGLMIELD